MTDDEFEQLAADSLDFMHRAIDECNQEWDFQSYGRFDVSLDRGVLSFTDGPRPPIDCDIQVVGTYMTNRNVWRWSWDNPSIELPLRGVLEEVRHFGEENAIKELTVGARQVSDEEGAWVLAAIAAKLVGAKSVYRVPDEPRHVFLLITDIRPA